MKTSSCKAVILVDEQDSHLLGDYHWYPNYNGYVVRDKSRSEGPPRGKIRLHRQILAAPAGVDVDHINGNKLDNRRSNLRLCSRSENLCNRTKSTASKARLKGACYCKQTGRWIAMINVGGKQVWLGRHDTQEEAAEAYRQASLKHHGEFSVFRRPS